MSNQLSIPVGAHFGRLKVIEEAPRGQHHRQFRCQCRCGNEIVAQLGHLRSGHTTSCGCRARSAAVKHGAYGSPEYTCWCDMKQRCGNPKNRGFDIYGGRGIQVCDRWRDSFMAFLSDMGPRPAATYSIERIDNNGSYSPENCRWATQKQQCNNQRKTKLVTIEGVTLCLLDWSKRTGIPYGTLNYRIYRLGIEPSEAMKPGLNLPKGRASWKIRSNG